MDTETSSSGISDECMTVIGNGIDLSKCTQIVKTAMPKCSEKHLHLGTLIFCFENKMLPSGPELCKLVLELKEQREEHNWKQYNFNFWGKMFSLNCKSTLREIDVVIFNFKELFSYFNRIAHNIPKKKDEESIKDKQTSEEKQTDIKSTWLRRNILQQFSKKTTKCQ